MLSNLNGINRFSDMAIIDATYPSGLVTPKHFDRYNRISIILQGTLKESACKKEVFAHSGSIVLKPGDLYHQNEYGIKGSRIVSILLKDEVFTKLTAEQFMDYRWFHGLPTASTAFQIASKLTKISTEEDLYDSVIYLLSILKESFDPKNTLPPSWLKKIEEQIRDEYYKSLRTRDIAEKIGVHPVYLARVFRQYYGCSLKSFLQNIRIENAMQELGEMQKSLIHIALDAGFSDQSHFNRIFKKALNLPPGAFQKWLNQYHLSEP